MSSGSTTGIQALLERVATLQRGGRLDECGRLVDQALVQHPQAVALHRTRAQLAMASGDPALALAHMHRAVTLMPADAALHLQYGSLLAHQGQHAEATIHLAEAARQLPGSADAWYLLGLARQGMGDDTQALPALRKARSLAPERERVLEALAESEFRSGYPADALPLWQALLQRRPDDEGVCMRTAETLGRLGRHDEAAALYRQALAARPESADLWMALAQTSEDRGDRQAALDAYERALALKPGWGFPLAGMLGLLRGKAPASQVEQATVRLSDPGLPDADRALLGYELGKVHDAQGRHAEAMATWHDANAARRRMIGESDPASMTALAAATMAAFPARRFQQRPWPGSPDPRPLLIVGMPRSGTTLTEQILAAHPLGAGCGELPDLALIARNLPAHAGPEAHWPQCIDQVPASAWGDAVRRYLDAATRLAPPQAQRLVDKAPLNFFHLGLLALLFPQARVVWCRRDPRDIAVSVYGENFALEERLATSLDGIGHYINLQTRLMRHWQQVLPLPILELCYEDLARDPEPLARQLVDFAGLSWDPACLEFHRSERGVQTPSRWQVKQPIYTGSIARWRHHAAELAPLLQVLDADAYPPSVAAGRASSDQPSTPSA